MKYVKKLVGSRIYLSPMNLEDANTYVKWMNDPKVTDGTGMTCSIMTLEAEKEWMIQNAKQYQFAIVSLADDKLLGNCGIQEINHIRQCATVGLFLGEEEVRSQGYGAEALHLLLEYGFFCLNLNNIMLQVFSFNKRAITCYQKVGFQEIGRRRQAYYLNGAFHDQVFMDILRDEYRKI